MADKRAMTTKPPKRPRDPNQLAKLMVDIATGEDTDVKQAARAAPRRKPSQASQKDHPPST